MNLKPTNLPLTAKDFDTARCGVCGGCGCSCGYILYLKEGEIADLYGHPHDPNGIGSFCTKGITLIQEVPKNPLRLSSPLIRSGDTFKEISYQEAVDWAKENLKGRVGVFLDRSTDLIDYSIASSITSDVYSDSLYLPFKASSLRPQEWRDQRVILALECEPVFSEVMATRWLVDAFERSAYILSVSSRYGTTSAKASKRILLKPPQVAKFLSDLANSLEDKEVSSPFKEEIERLRQAFTLVKESLILIGDSLLRSPWRGTILSALRRIRKIVRVNYSIVGNISPLETKGIEDFRRDLPHLSALVVFGNPALYMSEEDLKVMKGKPVLSFSLFPNLTAHNSSVVIPALTFAQREFINFRSGFGFISHSPKTLDTDLKDPREILKEVFGAQEDFQGYLRKLGIDIDVLKTAEGGVDINLPLIEDWEEEISEDIPEDEGMYVMVDNALVEDTGHWNPWTHDIEKEQFAYLNRKTAQKLGVKDAIDIRGKTLKVKIVSTIADDTIFIPNSYEETQPFGGGIRPGEILAEPGNRIEPYG